MPPCGTVPVPSPLLSIDMYEVAARVYPSLGASQFLESISYWFKFRGGGLI